jgi:hypothetical protein
LKYQTTNFHVNFTVAAGEWPEIPKAAMSGAYFLALQFRLTEALAMPIRFERIRN